MKIKLLFFIALLCAVVQGAWAYEQEVEYVRRSWDGTKVVNEKAKTVATLLDVDADEGACSLSGNWFVYGNHDTNGRIYVEEGRELNIILCDGATLTTMGILVFGNSTLRIFAQEHETGRINAHAKYDNVPAIGQYKSKGAVIEIHGGNITAEAGNYAAGIGASEYEKGANPARIDIYGGTINATGGFHYPGIGVSKHSNYGVINIYGGNITATGGGCGAGIGGGVEHRPEQINIIGGRIIAYAGQKGAAIGGGSGADGGNIFISGGYVEAHGDTEYNFGAGIGGGAYASGGNITISGGTVIAWAGYDAAGIGSGEEAALDIHNYDGGNITITGGNVTAYGNSYGAGIGGGERAAKGNIKITGGIVHAVAGEDKGGVRAIWGDDEKDGANSLVIGNNMKVWDRERSAMNSERYAFCEYRGEVCLSTCDHNGTWGPATFTDKGNGTHDVANCHYCYVTNEAHTFDSNLECTRCHIHGTSIATLSGSGTQEDPYLITSPADWIALSDYSMAASTKGMYFRQTEDVVISRTLGILSAQYAFGGVYDGAGHTIDVSGITGEAGGPFPHIEDATIRRLHIVGTMTGSVCAGGLVGVSDGTCLVEDCRVSSTITGNANATNGPHLGGIVGHGNRSKLTVRGCLFDGQLIASSSYTSTDKFAGAIVGWCNDAMNIQTIDCLEQGTYTGFPNVTLNYLNNGSATAVKKTNCYSLSHDWISPHATSTTEQTGVTALCTYPTTSITFYKNYVTVGNSWFAISDYVVTDNITLADDTDNSTVINDNNGHCANVTLSGRPLYKDGGWNTLCLPFDLELSGSPLDGDGVDVRTLSGSTTWDGTLILRFADMGDNAVLKAGVPYLIKWDNVNTTLTEAQLVFRNVTIKSGLNNSSTEQAQFVGTFNAIDNQTATDMGAYVLKSDGAWYRIGNDTEAHRRAYIPACRGYLLLSGNSGVRRLSMAWDDTATDMKAVRAADAQNVERRIFDLSGRQVKNHRHGIFIINGKKVKK